jgi:High-affinity Fe2+/Pb2+ permease
VGAAVGASLLTAVALETIFVLSPSHREGLEGGTMVVATAVLFYVSYWLLSKMEVVKWNHFVKSKVQDALDSGSALALASAAFLAVYREGFETVLFYKALFVAGAGGTMPVLAGIAAGSVVLVGVYVRSPGSACGCRSSHSSPSPARSSITWPSSSRGRVSRSCRRAA